jgi:hypothetical protein
LDIISVDIIDIVADIFVEVKLHQAVNFVRIPDYAYKQQDYSINQSHVEYNGFISKSVENTPNNGDKYNTYHQTGYIPVQ